MSTGKPSSKTPPKGAGERRKPVADPRFSLLPMRLQLSAFNGVDDERFEMQFYEDVLRQDPCNEDVLMVLGHAYTTRGEYEKGLEVDRRLVRLRPSDPTAYYNLACSYSLMGQLDESIMTLEHAISLGYRDFDHMVKDPDLENLRKDARFRRLIARRLSGSAKNSSTS